MKNELFGSGSVRLTSSASVSESESVSRAPGSFEPDADADPDADWVAGKARFSISAPGCDRARLRE